MAALLVGGAACGADHQGLAAPASTAPGVTTPGPGPATGERRPGTSGTDAPPSTAGLSAGRAPTPAPRRSDTHTVPTIGAGDDPIVAAGRVGPPRANLGGDSHPIVPQQPFGTIEIPKTGLNHPVYEGVELPNLHWGPGHWPGTALPGQFGNTVFAGHRVTHTRPFLDIDRLAPGDQIIITTQDGRFVYEVTGHEIVNPDDVRIAEPTLTPTVTLMACHPKGSARQRYVVRGRLIG